MNGLRRSEVDLVGKEVHLSDVCDLQRSRCGIDDPCVTAHQSRLRARTALCRCTFEPTLMSGPHLCSFDIVKILSWRERCVLALKIRRGELIRRLCLAKCLLLFVFEVQLLPIGAALQLFQARILYSMQCKVFSVLLKLLLLLGEEVVFPCGSRWLLTFGIESRACYMVIVFTAFFLSLLRVLSLNFWQAFKPSYRFLLRRNLKRVKRKVSSSLHHSGSCSPPMANGTVHR